MVVVDDGALEVRAGVIAAQALHHGNAHREQVCVILTGQGVEPPDIQAWAYAWATGRIWERTAAGTGAMEPHRDPGRVSWHVRAPRRRRDPEMADSFEEFYEATYPAPAATARPGDRGPGRR